MKDSMKNKEYIKRIREEMPKSKHLKTMLRAFLVGGIICCIGQGISEMLVALNPALKEKEILQYTTLIIITITGILTGFGVYDHIGKFGGAGSVIPITGFANSIISPAIERKTEGIILGLCNHMFTIAGPVIVLGISASIFVGFLALIFPGWFA